MANARFLFVEPAAFPRIGQRVTSLLVFSNWSQLPEPVQARTQLALRHGLHGLTHCVLQAGATPSSHIMKSPVLSPLTGHTRWPCNQRLTPTPRFLPSVSSPLPGPSCRMLRCHPSSKKSGPLTSLAAGSCPKPLTTSAIGPPFVKPTLLRPPC